MNIAIIGTGNVGGALAFKWAEAGHKIHLGVRDEEDFKGQQLLSIPNILVDTVHGAVEKSEVVLLATPAMAAIQVAKSLGNTTGKVILDAMNIVRGKGPEGYSNTSEAILEHTETNDLAKCFNTTGYNNMIDTKYEDQYLDMFTCGNSEKAKSIARVLSTDAGFGECYDIGGNDKFMLIEQFAWFWINLAMVQGLGREIGFKLLKR